MSTMSTISTLSTNYTAFLLDCADLLCCQYIRQKNYKWKSIQISVSRWQNDWNCRECKTSTASASLETNFWPCFFKFTPSSFFKDIGMAFSNVSNSWLPSEMKISLPDLIGIFITAPVPKQGLPFCSSKDTALTRLLVFPSFSIERDDFLDTPDR